MFHFVEKVKSADGLICQHEQLLDQMQIAENRRDGRMINELSKLDLQVCKDMAARGCVAVYDAQGEIVWVRG